MKRFPVGSRVWLNSPGAQRDLGVVALVLAHGRDARGIYTLIEYGDGTRERVHRDYLSKLEGVEDGRWNHS